MANELKKHICTRCGEDFVTGKWFCEDGQRHQVELKTYYVKTQGLTIHYGLVQGENVMNHRRDAINFARGTFQTADPEQQEFLDDYAGCVTADVWRDINLSEKERTEASKREKSRLEQQNNDLLAQVQKLQAQVAEKDAAAAGEQGKKGGK